MPRLVVPSAPWPRSFSIARSIRRWYGSTTWARSDTQTRPSRSMPRPWISSISSQEDPWVHDDAVGDHVHGVRLDHAGGEHVEDVVLLADDDGVPGVRAALESDDDVGAGREEVYDPTLALVAPLHAEDARYGHEAAPICQPGSLPGRPRPGASVLPLGAFGGPGVEPLPGASPARPGPRPRRGVGSDGRGGAHRADRAQPRGGTARRRPGGRRPGAPRS